jgi:hypothetical protein
VSRLLYLIGIPGSGKSTLLKAALEGLTGEQVAKPVPHFRYERGAQIGVVRKDFPGTDGLSMSIQPRVLDWLQSGEAPLNLVAEGDRLGTVSFFTAARLFCDLFSVVYLDTPERVAAARRWMRGSRQDPAWVAGRLTKVRNLKPFALAEWILDGSRPVEELAVQLRQHPVIRAIRGEEG